MNTETRHTVGELTAHEWAAVTVPLTIADVKAALARLDGPTIYDQLTQERTR